MPGVARAIQPDGSIAEDGVRRVIDAVHRAATAARDLHVDRLYACATSAIRDASNATDVALRLTNETGVQPRFLTGEDEARLTYLAVRRWYGWSAGRLLVLDIGGGSMEIALGRDAQPDFAVSLPLGAGRLTRAFLPEDRPGHQVHRGVPVGAPRRHPAAPPGDGHQPGAAAHRRVLPAGRHGRARSCGGHQHQPLSEFGAVKVGTRR
ncbi:hypothetical protein AB0E69_08375 [Kribbella sp. NPDC026611]|uniref:Ppx/GppA phosphatase family protein n=1 Tax=Kribbella sp. NPDC026611 TaxID=3154911 RepID=UPI0033DE7E0D